MIVVFISCSLMTANSEAREFDWAQVSSVNLSTNPTYLKSSLALTPLGEPIRAYLTQSHLLYNSQYLGDFQLEQYSATGALAWSQELLGKVHVQGLESDSENSLLVYGSYRDSITFDETHQLVDSNNEIKPFLLKLNSLREVVWFLDPSIENPQILEIKTLTIDSHDNVWIGSQQPAQETALHRLNADGTIAENLIQNGVRLISDLSVDPDGTIWAAGSCGPGNNSFNGLVSNCPFDYAVYLVRYSSGGVGQWVNYVEDVTFQSPQVQSDGSGHVYFAGALHGDFPFGNLIPEGPEWGDDFFLTRVDAMGEFLWLKEVMAGNSASAGIGSGGSLYCPPDGSVYFAGFSRNGIDWNGDGQVTPDFGWTDVLVLNFSSDGDFLLAKTAGSSWFDIADAVVVNSQGNIFLAGQVSANSEFDEMIFGGGFINSFITSLPRDNGLSPVNTPLTAFKTSAHPNPFNPRTIINFELPSSSLVSLNIFDMGGYLVKSLINHETKSSGVHSAVWSGQNNQGRAMPSAMYFYRLDIGSESEIKKITLLR